MLPQSCTVRGVLGAQTEIQVQYQSPCAFPCTSSSPRWVRPRGPGLSIPGSKGEWDGHGCSQLCLPSALRWPPSQIREARPPC